MTGLIKDIEEAAKNNTYFRKVLETGTYTQVVVMNILPNGEIGEEVHPNNDQVLLCIQGEGKVTLGGEESEFKEDDLVLVRAGTEHNFINTGKEDMKIVTTYSPPHHKSGTVHKTKQEADQAGY